MKPKKKKDFIQPPDYPGGNFALREFITRNLKYPEAALQNRVSGTVHLTYSVDSDGRVADVQVMNGLGYGCDEEAVRLIRLLKFNPSRTRKLRVGSSHKIKINFNLPKAEKTIHFTYKATEKKKEEPVPHPPVVYTYSIKV